MQCNNWALNTIYPSVSIFQGICSITVVELWSVDLSFKKHLKRIVLQVPVLLGEKVKKTNQTQALMLDYMSGKFGSREHCL